MVVCRTAVIMGKLDEVPSESGRKQNIKAVSYQRAGRRELNVDNAISLSKEVCKRWC